MSPALPSVPEGSAKNGHRKSRGKEDLPHVPWKDVLAMILAGFQVVFPSILILGVVVTLVLCVVLALLR